MQLQGWRVYARGHFCTRGPGVDIGARASADAMPECERQRGGGSRRLVSVKEMIIIIFHRGEFFKTNPPRRSANDLR